MLQNNWIRLWSLPSWFTASIPDDSISFTLTCLSSSVPTITLIHSGCRLSQSIWNLKAWSCKVSAWLIDAAHKYPIPLISTWGMRWLSEREWEAIDQRQITAAPKARPLRAAMGVCGMRNRKWKLSGITCGNEMDKKGIKGYQRRCRGWFHRPSTPYPMLQHKPSKRSPNPQLKSSWHVNFIKLAQMKRELRRKEDNSVIPFLLLFRVNHFFSTTLPPWWFSLWMESPWCCQDP